MSATEDGICHAFAQLWRKYLMELGSARFALKQECCWRMSSHAKSCTFQEKSLTLGETCLVAKSV
jgi:hypothetical protein